MWLLSFLPMLALACVGGLVNPHDEGEPGEAAPDTDAEAASETREPPTPSDDYAADSRGDRPVKLATGTVPTRDDEADPDEAALLARLLALADGSETGGVDSEGADEAGVAWATAPAPSVTPDTADPNEEDDTPMMMVQDFVTEGPHADVLQVALTPEEDPESLAVAEDPETGDSLLTVEARGELRTLARIEGGIASGFSLDQVMVVS